MKILGVADRMKNQDPNRTSQPRNVTSETHIDLPESETFQTDNATLVRDILSLKPTELYSQFRTILWICLDMCISTSCVNESLR